MATADETINLYLQRMSLFLLWYGSSPQHNAYGPISRYQQIEDGIYDLYGVHAEYDGTYAMRRYAELFLDGDDRTNVIAMCKRILDVGVYPVIGIAGGAAVGFYNYNLGPATFAEDTTYSKEDRDKYRWIAENYAYNSAYANWISARPGQLGQTGADALVNKTLFSSYYPYSSIEKTQTIRDFSLAVIAQLRIRNWAGVADPYHRLYREEYGQMLIDRIVDYMLMGAVASWIEVMEEHNVETMANVDWSIRPYMIAHGARALIRYYESEYASATMKIRIEADMRKLCDLMYPLLWRVSDFSQGFLERVVVASWPNELPAPDVSCMVVPLYAWVWSKTGEEFYRYVATELLYYAARDSYMYQIRTWNRNILWMEDAFKWLQWYPGGVTP